jgi:hypothetical protein
LDFLNSVDPDFFPIIPIDLIRGLFSELKILFNFNLVILRGEYRTALSSLGSTLVEFWDFTWVETSPPFPTMEKDFF